MDNAPVKRPVVSTVEQVVAVRTGVSNVKRGVLPVKPEPVSCAECLQAGGASIAQGGEKTSLILVGSELVKAWPPRDLRMR